MKQIITATAWTAAALAPMPAISQSSSVIIGGQEIQLHSDTSAEIRSVSGKYNSGKVYLKWLAANIKEDGMFIVYRAEENGDFKAIGCKQAIGVPTDKEIAYYFTDETYITREYLYKVLYVSKSASYIFSGSIKAGVELTSAYNLPGK